MARKGAKHSFRGGLYGPRSSEIKTGRVFESGVFSCTCTNDFQDRLLGQGRRRWNPMVLKGVLKGYRCTVCSSQRGA